MVLEGERSFLTELLSGLKETDLFALASTTTGGKITPKDKHDAIDCIILHSDCAESILKRKKITKDFLFNYLHAKKVGVLVSDEKPRLIQYILQLWSGDGNLPEQVIADNRGSNADGRSSNATITNIAYNNTIINCTTEHITTASGPSVSLPKNISGVSSEGSPTLNDQRRLDLDEHTVNTLAFKFTEWFYNLLNKNFKGGLIAVNSEHFWSDADFILRIKLKSYFSSTSVVNVGSNIIEEEHVHGIEDIIVLLNKIKDKYQIYFSPNLCLDGVRGKSDRHGGVLILACGTLHKDIGQMCGAFEQVFLIFRDPLTEDNWKIKKTEMHLISVDHNNMLSLPTINDTCLKTCLL